MPYRLSPKKRSVVQVKRRGRWVTLKRHTSRVKARAHVRALGLNVSRRHGGRRK